MSWDMLLDGRPLLVTGVLTESSIAFSVARRAQEEGAEVVLTGFGRGLRITQRMARRLPAEPDVLELDVNDPDAARGGRRRARAPLGRASTACCTPSPSCPPTRWAGAS